MAVVDAFPAFLTGGGDLGALIRRHPWAETPLGRPDSWPQSLRSALSICLHSSFPTAIYWGPDLRLLYNDAWSPIPAERHPWALGRPAADVWPDIWDVVGPQFERVLQSGEGFSTYDQMLPMVRDGATRETYWTYSITAIRGEDGAIVGVFNQGNETTAAVMARRQAEAEVERLERMFAQAPGAVAILRGPTHEFEFVNAAYEALVGRAGLTGKTVAEALPEVVSQGFVDLLDRVFSGGQPHVGHAAPVSLMRNLAGPPDDRFVDFVFQPLLDHAGACSGIFVQITDVTEQRRAEESRQLLLHEMSHRVKNLFAIATGMVAMTARTAPSVPAMASSLRGRLAALAKAHDLALAGANGGSLEERETTLRSLLEAIVQPHLDDSRVPPMTLEGPDIRLGPNTATTLALIFHELATNAAKYGAFSTPEGRLAVDWTARDGHMYLNWIETVPAGRVSPPQSLGFGSALARSSATGQLGGEISFAWPADGVRIAMVVPEDRLSV